MNISFQADPYFQLSQTFSNSRQTNTSGQSEDAVVKSIGNAESSGTGNVAVKDNSDISKKNESAPHECETCKHRKYQDDSNEGNVSFQSAAHIAPQAAAAVVRSHEGEHVFNAYHEASQQNAKVVNASVSIHTSVCPECGRTYVSGGTTNTQIKYYNESNPYQQNMKSADSLKYSGMNINQAG